MEDKGTDKKITEALLHGTKDVEGLKEEVWRNIKMNLEGAKMEDKGLERKRVSKGRNRWLWASVAAAVFAVFVVGTDPGQAAKKIKEILLPEKRIVEELEGQKENTEVELHENRGAKYAIYFDKERYSLEKVGGKERIVPKVKPTGDYPEVYMEISQDKDKAPQELAVKIEQELKERFPIVKNYGTVEEPLPSIALSALSGRSHNSTVIRYYLVDNKIGGTFVIKQQFFLEAEEGHGARYYNMLKEFKIIK